jgi:hypothetical protein
MAPDPEGFQGVLGKSLHEPKSATIPQPYRPDPPAKSDSVFQGVLPSAPRPPTKEEFAAADAAVGLVTSRPIDTIGGLQSRIAKAEQRKAVAKAEAAKASRANPEINPSVYASVLSPPRPTPIAKSDRDESPLSYAGGSMLRAPKRRIAAKTERPVRERGLLVSYGGVAGGIME